MQTFREQALKDINDRVYKAGTRIEILDDGKFYYNFMFIGISGVEVDKYNNTIIKLLELSNTEFNEDNQTYRFSLEELIEGRAYFLKREKEKADYYNNLFSNIKK